AFVPVEYWSIEADLKAALPPQFRAKLIKLDGEKIELGSQEVTQPLVEELRKLPFTVQSVEKKERRRNAPAPFITSKLQQEAANPVQFKTKKSAQDAHEAIRPTSAEYEPALVQKHLDRDMFRLYELIWNRFIACQMVPAVFDQTTADIEARSSAPDLPKHPAERA